MRSTPCAVCRAARSMERLAGGFGVWSETLDHCGDWETMVHHDQSVIPKDPSKDEVFAADPDHSCRLAAAGYKTLGRAAQGHDRQRCARRRHEPRRSLPLL